MYDLNNVEQNARDITEYVKNCMKQNKLGASEIREYDKQSKMYDFNHLLTVSQEYIDMLNQMNEQQTYTSSYEVQPPILKI